MCIKATLRGEIASVYFRGYKNCQIMNDFAERKPVFDDSLPWGFVLKTPKITSFESEMKIVSAKKIKEYFD